MGDPFAPGLLRRLSEPPRKVAVVRASRVGDFICATPALRALRAALPAAEITLIGLPLVADLAHRSPHLDRFEPFPGFPGIAEQFFDARRASVFFRRMQAEQFDLAIQLHGSGVYSNPFTLMLGARQTAGWVRPGDSAIGLDAALPAPQVGHEVSRVLTLTTFLGCPSQGEQPELALWPEDHAAAEELLAGLDRPLVGIAPGGREPTKRWYPQRFVAAGLALRRDGTLVLLSAPEEREVADTVARAVGGRCVNLAGRTSLGVLGAVIARLDLLLTNDSAPAHVAYALGTPSVTVFGRTDPARWGPPAGRQHRVVVNPVPCWPCDYVECPIGYRCLDGSDVAQVVAAAEAALGSGRAASLSPAGDRTSR